MPKQLLLLALALGWLPAQTALAQFNESSYGGSLEALEAHNRELEAEAARCRAILDESLAGGGSCCGDCCLTPAAWFDPCCCGPTWSAYVAGDAWRDVADVDGSNNFGNRFGIDATWAINDCGVRGHAGMGYGVYDYHGRDFLPSQSSTEQQVYLTAGVYRRASGCCGDQWTWAASYDFLNDNHYGQSGESIDLHQVRFLVGRMMNPCNEVGVWGAFGVADDDYGRFLWPPGRVEVQDQVNLYWRRYWDFGGQTMLYAGLAQTNFFSTENVDLITLPGTESGDDYTEFVIGLRGTAPLTCNMGLFGGAHYVIPSSGGGTQPPAFFPAAVQESWNVTFGVVWVRGCSLPLLPTADNGWLGKRTSGFLQRG